MHSKILPSLLLVAVLWSTTPAIFAQQSSPRSPSADRYLKILAALGKHEYIQAFAESKSLILDDPGFPLAYEKLFHAARRRGELEEARTFFASLLINSPKNPRGHFGLGLIARQRGDENAAFEDFKRCLQAVPEFVPAYIAMADTAQALNRLLELEPFILSLPQTAASLYGLSYLRYSQVRYQAAIELSEEALVVDPLLLEAYKTKAQSLYALNRYADAQQAAETLIKEVTAPEKVELRISGLIIKGIASAVTGDSVAGVADLTSAYRLSIDVGNQALEESVHSQFAFVYDRQNDCAQSLRHAQAALALGTELRSRYLSRYVNNIGAVYACLGDSAEAANYYQQALKIQASLKSPDKSIQFTLLTNIAGNLANRAEALALLEQALTLSKDIQNKVMELRARLRLATLYSQNGDYLDALAHAKAALQIAQETGVAFQEGKSWNQLGTIHFSLFETNQAIDDYRRALAIGERTEAPQIVWEAQAGIAAALHRQGNSEQAAQHYRQAVETIDGIRSRIGIPEDRASFLVGKIDVYKKLLGVLFELQDKDKSKQAEAFRYAERARARAFSDLLAEAKIDPEQSAAPDLLNQKQELQRRISQLTAQLIKERSQETSKQNKPKIGDLEKGLAQADSELSDWLREVRRRNPRYASLKYPEPVTLVDVQRILDDRTILLSYSLANPKSFLFAVSRNDFQVRELPSEITISSDVQALLAAIIDKNNPAPQKYRRLVTRLSRELLQPVGRILAGKKALVIVADGTLHRLPFESLVLPNTPAGGDLRRLPYLIREFAISYAPSASVLVELHNETHEPAPKGFIAFGDPIYGTRPEDAIASTLRTANDGRFNLQRLPYSQTEIDGIAQLFAQEDREIFFGAEASEENVKAPERLSRYRMVHFSTHGYVNETRPRFSGLVLSLPQDRSLTAANSQWEDGLLSAYEILNLKLKADLVVLSACETGLGKEVKGEGLMSLTRAFMYAGTPSVVVSLWNVNDESAADIMIRFYRNLKIGGMNKSEALRRAKLETISDNGFPFFWAPFVLVGKP